MREDVDYGEKPYELAGKKFKMKKELARLNQELRTQRPLSPDEKRLQRSPEANWGAKARGLEYQRRRGGTGGGHIPGLEKRLGSAPRT